MTKENILWCFFVCDIGIQITNDLLIFIQSYYQTHSTYVNIMTLTLF